MAQKQRKIAVMGHRAVGKSSICVQFVDNHFVESYNPTIENTFVKEIKHKGINYAIELVDTAGQDDQELFQSQYAIGVHGYALVYSCASKASLEIIKDLNDKLLNAHGADRIPRVLVGNKTDLRIDRQVSTEEGKALADKWGCGFVECSAKQNVNIVEMIGLLLDQIELFQAPEEPKRTGCVCM